MDNKKSRHDLNECLEVEIPPTVEGLCSKYCVFGKIALDSHLYLCKQAWHENQPCIDIYGLIFMGIKPGPGCPRYEGGVE